MGERPEAELATAAEGRCSSAVGHRAEAQDAPERADYNAVRSKAAAPCLSKGSFQLPHFGDCTHDGHPSLHPHDDSTSSVAARWRSAAPKPSSAIPAPPG